MILVFSDWWLPWSSTVLATDASEEGFAVAQSEWDVSAVKDCGRVLEKSRWRLGAAQARSHAQLTGGVDFEPHAIVDEVRALRLDRWEHVSDFPQVPPGRLAASSWKLVRYGRWRFSDGILRLEARALERGVSRFAQFKLGRDIRVLSLCDNMAVTLAVGRSRATYFGLFVQIWRINAWRLLRNIKLCVRWVPSEFNPSDSGSRMYSASYDKSKDMTLTIDALRKGQVGESGPPGARIPASHAAEEERDSESECHSAESCASSSSGSREKADDAFLECRAGRDTPSTEAPATAEPVSRRSGASEVKADRAPR